MVPTSWMDGWIDRYVDGYGGYGMGRRPKEEGIAYDSGQKSINTGNPQASFTFHSVNLDGADDCRRIHRQTGEDRIPTKSNWCNPRRPGLDTFGGWPRSCRGHRRVDNRRSLSRQELPAETVVVTPPNDASWLWMFGWWFRQQPARATGTEPKSNTHRKRKKRACWMCLLVVPNAHIF